jgi:hypothetical protein
MDEDEEEGCICSGRDCEAGGEDKEASPTILGSGSARSSSSPITIPAADVGALRCSGMPALEPAPAFADDNAAWPPHSGTDTKVVVFESFGTVGSVAVAGAGAGALRRGWLPNDSGPLLLVPCLEGP